MLPKSREKKSEFFSSSFFGVNLTKNFCEVNLEFFLEIFISRVFFLSFTSTKARDFLSIEFLELFSLPKNQIHFHHSCSATIPSATHVLQIVTVLLMLS
jgi:hypothetical protein